MTEVDSPERHERRLPNLPSPSFKSFFAKIQRSPIIPIVVCVLITGWAQDVLMVNLGIACCVIWQSWDLWPLADWFSLKIATKKFSDFEGSKRSAEIFRRKQQRKIRLTIFLLMFLLTSATGITVGILVTKNINTKTRNEIFQLLHGSLSLSQNATLNNSKFTITNNSLNDIHLRSLGCELNYYQTVGNAIGQGFELVPFNGDIILHHGGDARSENCPENTLLGLAGNPAIRCADIVWSAQYSIGGDPEKLERSAMRAW